MLVVQTGIYGRHPRIWSEAGMDNNLTTVAFILIAIAAIVVALRETPDFRR